MSRVESQKRQCTSCLSLSLLFKCTYGMEPSLVL